EGPPGFPLDQVSDRSDAFMVMELVREQLFRQLGQELPYAPAVKLESVEERDGRVEISAAIWVEKASQKGIVIGNGGKRIRELGTRARQSIEEYLGKRVYLELWVRVREGWRERPDALGQLGYAEEG
ncbi:MAG: KH domain-containing protein, partial [Gammaproteobacteria bacterium]|nr:KH domain-containing protein [Gammaproteobacteria bacterium]